MQAIKHRLIITSLFIWAVTVVAAQNIPSDGKTLCTKQLQQAID